jgi:ABC-type sugar transport system substrate-binding protein
MTGIPAAAMKPQLAEAAKKGIPVASCGTTDKAAPNGYAMECDGTLQPTAEYIGAWITNHSEGKGKILGVSIPQFPALVSETEWMTSPGFKEMCPQCSYEELAVTVEDLAQGSVGQKVVGVLQAHPEIDYVYATLGDLTVGVPEVLKSTGGALGEVTVVAALDDAFTVEGVANGKIAATTPTPNEYMSWVMIDGLARISLEGKLSPEYQKNVYENIATWVLDDPKLAESLPNQVWPGPENFQAQFRKLWGAS